MVERQQFGNGPDRNHAFVGQHRHPVANLIQGIQIVGDQEYGVAQSILQFAGQGIERGRANRVQSGSRLVQKQQLGIHRQGPGEAGALSHTARKLGRVLVGRFIGQA